MFGAACQRTYLQLLVNKARHQMAMRNGRAAQAVCGSAPTAPILRRIFGAPFSRRCSCASFSLASPVAQARIVFRPFPWRSPPRHNLWIFPMRDSMQSATRTSYLLSPRRFTNGAVVQGSLRNQTTFSPFRGAVMTEPLVADSLSVGASGVIGRSSQP